MARSVIPAKEVSTEELVAGVHSHLENIRDAEQQTKMMQELVSRALTHLVNQEWSDVRAALDIHRADCLTRLGNLSPSKYAKQRGLLQTLIAKDREWMRLLFVEKYRPVLEGLKKLREQAQMQEAKNDLQSAIVKFQEGDAEPARKWIKQQIRTRQRLIRQARMHSQKTIHRVHIGELQAFLKRLPS